MRRYEITDRQWLLVAPLLPGKAGDVGRTASDNRLFLNAVLWVGGWSTKIHAAVDALGNPLRIILTVGQRGDATQAEGLLGGYRPGAVLADRGYDTDGFLDCVREAGAEPVIPSKKNRLQKREIDGNLYKDRNKVERFFNKLKAYRRVATRYEKTADSFSGFVYLASIRILMQ